MDSLPHEWEFVTRPPCGRLYNPCRHGGAHPHRCRCRHVVREGRGLRVPGPRRRHRAARRLPRSHGWAPAPVPDRSQDDLPPKEDRNAAKSRRATARRHPGRGDEPGLGRRSDRRSVLVLVRRQEPRGDRGTHQEVQRVAVEVQDRGHLPGRLLPGPRQDPRRGRDQDGARGLPRGRRGPAATSGRPACSRAWRSTPRGRTAST